MPLHLIAAFRAFHVLAGALWVGGAFINVMFVVPAVQGAGPAGGAVMRQLVQVRRMPQIINAIMGINVLSGLALYAWASSGFQPSWITSPSGATFTLGAALALASVVYSLVFVKPALDRIGKLGAAIGAGPPTPAQGSEMAALQARLRRIGMVGIWLLLLATVAMAVARYV
jgi:uncharacterized membrane protein